MKTLLLVWLMAAFAPAAFVSPASKVASPTDVLAVSTPTLSDAGPIAEPASLALLLLSVGALFVVFRGR